MFLCASVRFMNHLIVCDAVRASDDRLFREVSEVSERWRKRKNWTQEEMVSGRLPGMPVISDSKRKNSSEYTNA